MENEISFATKDEARVVKRIENARQFVAIVSRFGELESIRTRIRTFCPDNRHRSFLMINIHERLPHRKLNGKFENLRGLSEAVAHMMAHTAELRHERSCHRCEDAKTSPTGKAFMWPAQRSTSLVPAARLTTAATLWCFAAWAKQTRNSNTGGPISRNSLGRSRSFLLDSA